MEKKKEAEGKEKAIKEHQKAGIRQVAAKEDEMEQQVANKHQNAARPNKVSNDSHQEYLKGQKVRQLLRHISSDVASNGEMELDEERGNVGVDADDPAEFPPMSTVDTSESEPEMSGMVDGEFGSKAGNEDFKPESEDESKDNEEEAIDDEDLEELFKSFLNS